jgi:peptide methionine sulfoxide reductase msrA/msrB
METDQSEERYELATFAGGCFWCMVAPFEEVAGVKKVVSGYIGGNKENPTYEEVCSGATGHCEAVQVSFDPSVVSYERLLEIFWRQIDPTDRDGQFYDRGPSYRAAIFYHNETQKKKAEVSRRALNASGRFYKPVVTQILPVSKFYPAEVDHQQYYKKKPLRYKMYRKGSGREAFLAKHWGQSSKTDGKQLRQLTRLQYQVTQNGATEPPFQNEYWDNQREGIYVDLISGEPLFSSKDKFNAGCGWPSFTKPLHPENIIEKEDLSHQLVRTEVKSKSTHAHLENNLLRAYHKAQCV